MQNSTFDDYEAISDFSIMRKVPIVIKANIRNFKRLTQNLTGAYSVEFYDVMSQAALYCTTYIQDAIFVFYHSDEVIFILRNDLDNNEPWFNNNIQKMVSTVSSLLTIGFYNSLNIMGNNLNLVGDCVFSSKIFSLPNINETINYLKLKQLDFLENSINNTLMIELEGKTDKSKLNDLLKKSFEDKSNILLRHCGINFDSYYSSEYLRGIGIYKIRTFIPAKDGGTSRNRWSVDHNIPDFSENLDFLNNILVKWT